VVLTFHKVKTPKACEEVAAQVRTAILAGRYTPGDRLPSTRDLCARFRVSRLPVLEALRVLESSGLVEIRRGARGGVFVRQPDTRPIDVSIDLVASMNGLTLSELAEFREVVESRNAYWAAQRGSGDAIRELRSAVDSAVRLARDPGAAWEKFLALDAQFHAKVAEAGGNRLSMAVSMGIMPRLRVALTRVPPRYKAKMLRDLTGILAAIEAGNPKRAEALMRTHIAQFTSITARARKERRKEGGA
jgi:GntR family transcriptional regulator, transcriptional repressor for pyruvate dehydrogenase complex